MTTAPPIAAARTRRFTPFLVLSAYVLVTFALTYPLITRMASGVPSDPGDPLLVSWILWWNAHTVPFSQAFWNAPAFFPATGVLAFSETFVGLSPLTTPIYWLTGNIQLGYNVAFLLTFILSAFFAYLLCREITGREDAAFIGGLLFGFTPYRIDQLPHMQMLVSFWMPLGLFALHRYLRSTRARWLVLFGVAWLMQGLSSGYLMMFFSVLVGAWLCWFLPVRQWRLWIRVGGTWAVASIPLLPVLLGYRRIHDYYGFHRSLDEIRGYSADITGLLQAPGQLLAWGWVNIFPRGEGAIFPGVTAVILITIALGLLLARSPAYALPRALRRMRIVCGTATVLFGAAALGARFAPWQVLVMGLPLSNTHADKPLRYGTLALLGWIGTTPGLVNAVRRRSRFAFYLAAAFLMWLLCLGPTPTFFGEKTPFTGPYTLLLDLPGFDSLRVPARFAMVMLLCLACGAALAFDHVASALSRTGRIAVTAVAVIFALADVWTIKFVVADLPPPWPIQAMEAHEPVVELPLGDPFRDIQTIFRSTYTGNPTVNGYSGNFPPWYNPLIAGLQHHDPAMLDELSGFGVRQVVLDMSVDDNKAWQQYFETRDDIALVAAEGTHRLYRLPPSSRPIADRVFGAPIPVASFETNANPQLIPALTDGDLRTRWQTGPQQDTHQLTVDLGMTRPIGAVVLAMGEFTTDAPRDLLVEVSDDRTAWTTVWRGTGERLMFRAVVRDARRVPITIDFGDRPARFIRFRQLGSDPVWYWSIAEFSVLSPPASGR